MRCFNFYVVLLHAFVRIVPTFSYSLPQGLANMLVNTRMSKLNYEGPFTSSVESNSNFISNLLENCDKCYLDQTNWNSSAYESFVINDLDIVRLAGDGMTISKTEVTDNSQNSVPVSRSLNLIDGIWKLRYSNKKWNTNYRGLPNFILSVNSSNNMLCHDIDFVNNVNKTLKKVTIGFELKNLSAPDSEIDNKNPSFMTKFKFMNVYRNKANIPFMKSFSTSWVFKIPFLNSVLKKKYFENKFPNIQYENFEIAYLDDDVFITVSEGEFYNVYSRLYQVWDPSVPTGWTYISVV